MELSGRNSPTQTRVWSPDHLSTSRSPPRIRIYQNVCVLDVVGKTYLSHSSPAENPLGFASTLEDPVEIRAKNFVNG